MKFALVLTAACLLLVGVNSRQMAQPKGVGLTIEVCTAPGQCQVEQAGLVVDKYLTGCTDNYNCYNNPGDYGQYDIKIEGNKLTLGFTNPQQGSRSYLSAGPNSDKYRMFYLMNKEFSFEVDVNHCGCGMNSALYLIAMDEDGGKSQGMNGAQYGTGYCDAQPAQPGRPACDEMDIWEANSLTSVFTTHPCEGGSCDAWGCSLNPYTRGFTNFYGRGGGFTVDSTRPHTVITQFITDDGTDNGNLKEIRRQFVQDGVKHELPYAEGYNSLSDAFCQHFYIPSSQGGSASTSKMATGLRRGMVLSFSLWGNPNDPNSMDWMDHPPNGPCPYTHVDPNPSTSFGKMRVGPIGSTA